MCARRSCSMKMNLREICLLLLLSHLLAEGQRVEESLNSFGSDVGAKNSVDSSILELSYPMQREQENANLFSTLLRKRKESVMKRGHTFNPWGGKRSLAKRKGLVFGESRNALLPNKNFKPTLTVSFGKNYKNWNYPETMKNKDRFSFGELEDSSYKIDWNRNRERSLDDQERRRPPKKILRSMEQNRKPKTVWVPISELEKRPFKSLDNEKQNDDDSSCEERRSFGRRNVIRGNNRGKPVFSSWGGRK